MRLKQTWQYFCSLFEGETRMLKAYEKGFIAFC